MLTKSNCDNFVTWSKLKNSCTNIKSNSGNNNDSGDNDKFKDVQCISKSLPNIRANCKNDWVSVFQKVLICHLFLFGVGFYLFIYILQNTLNTLYLGIHYYQAIKFY